jgi:Mrp family chromosome partitioning ATPase
MNNAQNQHKKQQEKIKNNLAKIKNKLVVIGGKGGVGKTTVAVNLAYALADKGKKVGILDVDMHGPNVAKMLGLDKERLVQSDLGIEPIAVLPNFKVISIALILKQQDQPIIWRGPLKMATISQFLADVNWGNLDYLIIDSPPGTGDEPLSVCQLISDINAAIVVTTPQQVAILDTRKSINFAKALKVPIAGVIENMSGFVCPHCQQEIDIFGKGAGAKAAESLEVPFLGGIPLETAIVSAGDSGRPFLQQVKDNNKTRESIFKIIDNINKFLGNGK